MTTRTLTVQADQRAYVPHALCIVKGRVLLGFACQKHLSSVSPAYAVMPVPVSPSHITFVLFLCLLF